MWIKEWLPSIRDLFQILFFTVIGTVTILTYLKAKKTLLQPIRTETFKEQIKIFSEILGLFTGKSEIDLRRDFDLDRLLQVNVWLLYDDYAALFFDISFDHDKRPYNSEECPVSQISIEMIEKRFKLIDDYLLPDEPRTIEIKPDPRTKAAIWGQYKFGEIKIPRALDEKQDEFRRVMDSPLLPQSLMKLLDDYVQTINQNIQLVSEIITECAQEMPEKYPNLDELKKASFHWIGNKYNERLNHLEEKAKKIISYLREYFTVDTIME